MHLERNFGLRHFPTNGANGSKNGNLKNLRRSFQFKRYATPVRAEAYFRMHIVTLRAYIKNNTKSLEKEPPFPSS